MQKMSILGVVAALIALAIGAGSGSAIASPDAALAGLGMLPFMLGETSMGDLADMLKKQGETFELFKKANDDRIKAIESKGFAPEDTVAKVEKINGDLTELGKQIADLAKKSNRPPAGDGGLNADQREYKAAFEKYLRKGDVTNLRDLEKKSFGMGGDEDGRYFIEPEMATDIDRIAGTVSALRPLADVRTIGKESLKFRVKKSGAAGRWVGAGEAGGETAGAKYASLEIVAEEMEAEPWALNSALDDADFDVAADITDEAGITFGEMEGEAFITGDGVKKPRGILTYTPVANANYAWGKVGYIASGAAGAFAATNPENAIIDLLHSLKSQYRNGAVLLMSDTTLAAIRKIENADGDHIFNIDATGKFQGFVWGAPVVIDDNMPTLAANSFSIAYANFARAYRIVDRKGIALIRDNLTEKGSTKFNFRKRVGGGIRNFEAIKLMKFAA